MTIDFLGIGAQKSGTSWIYANLKRHPAVFIPDCKEIHYWDGHFERGLEWYLGHFATAPAGARRGEITPAYGMLAPDRIADVRAHFPGVPLFFIMRNPIDRAWSAALMALRHADMTIDEASDQWFLDHFESRGSRRRGDYQTCLSNWRAAFPEAQILWLLYDDLLADPRRLISRVAGHIGIDAAWYDSLPDAVLRQKVLEGQGHPLRPRLREHLERLYAPRIDALEDYLGVDLSAWKQPRQTGFGGRLRALLGG